MLRLNDELTRSLDLPPFPPFTARPSLFPSSLFFPLAMDIPAAAHERRSVRQLQSARVSCPQPGVSAHPRRTRAQASSFLPPSPFLSLASSFALADSLTVSRYLVVRSYDYQPQQQQQQRRANPYAQQDSSYEMQQPVQSQQQQGGGDFWAEVSQAICCMSGQKGVSKGCTRTDGRTRMKRRGRKGRERAGGGKRAPLPRRRKEGSQCRDSGKEGGICARFCCGIDRFTSLLAGLAPSRAHLISSTRPLPPPLISLADRLPSFSPVPRRSATSARP